MALFPLTVKKIFLGALMPIWLFSKNTTQKKNTQCLYNMLVAHARSPVFYHDYGVKDTVDGRFDLLVLHFALVIRRLNTDKKNHKALQELTGIFVADMDANLREMGVGDLSVPKRVRKMLEALKGRHEAYHTAIDAGKEELSHALIRNLYRGIVPEKHIMTAFLDYIYTQDHMLKRANYTAILEGALRFSKPKSL